jgi:hypothetical protein
MNAFTNSMQKIALQTGRRFSSAVAAHVAPKKPFIPVRAASAKRSIFSAILSVNKSQIIANKMTSR